MAAEIHIRQADPGDAESVGDILNEAARWRIKQSGEPFWQGGELQPERVAEEVRAGLFFLAEIRGEAAGTFRLQLEDPIFWPDEPEPVAAYFHRLAVRRRYAGTGLSVTMLQWAARRAAVLGRRYVRLDCPASLPRLRAVYERFGFRLHSYRQVGPYYVARYEYDAIRPLT